MITMKNYSKIYIGDSLGVYHCSSDDDYCIPGCSACKVLKRLDSYKRKIKRLERDLKKAKQRSASIDEPALNFADSKNASGP